MFLPIVFKQDGNIAYIIMLFGKSPPFPCHCLQSLFVVDEFTQTGLYGLIVFERRQAEYGVRLFFSYVSVIFWLCA